MSGLKKFQLTEAETEFVHFAAFNLRRNNPLSEMMTLVLERIYSQKTAFIRDSITSLLKQDIPVTPSAQGSNQRSVTAGAKL
jgi:hypothetical protein